MVLGSGNDFFIALKESMVAMETTHLEIEAFTLLALLSREFWRR